MSIKDKGSVMWVARRSAEDSFYWLYYKKPKFDSKGNLLGEETEIFCPEKFERITGYKLSPGECRRVRIKIEEVK